MAGLEGYTTRGLPHRYREHQLVRSYATIDSYGNLCRVEVRKAESGLTVQVVTPMPSVIITKLHNNRGK